MTSRRTLLGLLLLLALSVSGARHAGALDGVVVTPMYWGRIIPGTSEETLEIDARSGFAFTAKVTSGTATVLNPGNSGFVRFITNSTAGGETVNLLFPTNVTLTLRGGGGQVLDAMNMYFMQERSQTSGALPVGQLDLYIGGRLDVSPGQQAGDYSADVNLTILIN